MFSTSEPCRQPLVPAGSTRHPPPAARRTVVRSDATADESREARRDGQGIHGHSSTAEIERAHTRSLLHQLDVVQRRTSQPRSASWPRTWSSRRPPRAIVDQPAATRTEATTQPASRTVFTVMYGIIACASERRATGT